MSVYKGYRVRIEKGSSEHTTEQVGVDNEISFNPDGGYSAQNQGSGEKVNSLRGGVLNVVLAQSAKRALDYGLSNYGNLTGDYVTQANIQGMIEAGTMIATALTGPVGAMAVAGNLAFKEISRQIEFSNKNRDVEFLKMRTGMVNLSGGR